MLYQVQLENGSFSVAKLHFWTGTRFISLIKPSPARNLEFSLRQNSASGLGQGLEPQDAESCLVGTDFSHPYRQGVEL